MVDRSVAITSDMNESEKKMSPSTKGFGSIAKDFTLDLYFELMMVCELSAILHKV